MKKLNFLVLLLAVGLVLGFTGCATDDDGKEPGGGDNGIDYTNYILNYSIKVQNDTSQKLVAFKGPPAANNLISGIPANVGAHGLKNDPAVFTTKQDFVLFLVTEENYLANKNNPSALQNMPFGTLYAYYNTNSVNDNVYRISKFMGGTKRIVLQNSSNYNIELRENSAEVGETIGFGYNGRYNITFNVPASNYMVFPVFRKYSDLYGEIMTAWPVFQEEGPLKGTAYYTTFELISRDEQQIFTSDFPSGTKFDPGAAFLIIDNQSAVGVSLFDGGNRQTTESGAYYINSNDSRIFPIYMIRTGATFRPWAQREQFRIGTEGAPFTIPSPQDSYMNIETGVTTENVYLQGKVYMIKVSGNTANALTFSSITQEGDWEW